MENLVLSLWIMLGIISGVGLLGNTMVFIVLRLEPNKLAVLYWLMCLAVVDFGSLVFWPMTAVSWRCSLPNETCFGTQAGLYGSSRLIQAMLLTVAGFVVLGASIDRYIAIAKPTSSRLLSTKKNAMVSIAVIATVAVALNGLCFILHDHTIGNVSVPEPSTSYEDLLVHGYNASDLNENYTMTLTWPSTKTPAQPSHWDDFTHIMGFMVTQALPLVLLVVFFILLLVVFTRATRQLSRQRHTRKRYLANVANTSVVLAVQALFIACGGFTVVHTFLQTVLPEPAITDVPTQEAMVVASIVLTCVRVSAMFFIFLALDVKFRAVTREFLLSCGTCDGRNNEPVSLEV